MKVEYGMLGLYVGGGKKESLELFAVAVGDGEILPDDSFVVDGALFGSVGVAFGLDLNWTDDILPGFFVDLHARL